MEYYNLWMLEESYLGDALSAGNDHLKTRANTKNLKAMELRVKEWLQEKLAETTRVCSSVLSSMNSALGIARLQRFVFMECLGISHPNKLFRYELRDGSIDYEFNVAWLESIEGLFGAAQKRLKIKDDSSYLWTVVFQKSFLDQATRLLQEASDQIFIQLCSKVKSILRNFGIQMDNGSIKVLQSSRRTVYPISSVGTFTSADQLHTEFRSSLTKLLDDVISPVGTT